MFPDLPAAVMAIYIPVTEATHQTTCGFVDCLPVPTSSFPPRQSSICSRWAPMVRALHSKRVTITCCEETENQNDATLQSEPEKTTFGHKYDPNSDTDAFGRDPRKETEYWMGTAKSLLESDEVKKAIENHAADGGDGYTDEQRAYLEFVKSLDENSSGQ